MEQLIAAFAPYGFGGLMALVVAGFYWHTISKTIPKMFSDFREEQELQRRADKTEQELQRKACKEEQAALIQAFEKQFTYQRESYERIMIGGHERKS